MNKTPQEEYQEKVDLIKFFGAVKGSLNEINTKVIDGSNLLSTNFDIQKLALEHDKATGAPVAAAASQQIPHQQLLNTDLAPSQYPVLAADHSSQQEDPNQLVLPFDKKYDLNDIFSKIDDVYRKIITLENEVYKLRELVENKKKEL